MASTARTIEVWATVLMLTAGAGLLLLAPVLALIGWAAGRQRNALRRAEVTPCGGLGAGGRLPRRAAVAGTTAAGPDGPLTSPISGVPCVWYRWRVMRRSPTGDVAEDLLENLWTQASGPFALRDGTGEVLVHAELLALDRHHDDPSPVVRAADSVPGPGHQALRPVALSVDTLLERGMLSAKVMPRRKRRGEVYFVEELVVTEGEAVFAYGRPAWWRGRVALGPPRRGLFLATTRTRDELLELRGTDARFGWGCAWQSALIGGILCGLGWLFVSNLS